MTPAATICRNQTVLVSRPQASDAVGDALRQAYDRQPKLPADLERLLLKIQ